VPEESIRVLEATGKWLDHNGASIYETESGNYSWGTFTNFTRRGNKLYVHVNNWPGDTPAEEWLSFYQPPSVIAIGGLKAKAKSARFLSSGTAVSLEQDQFSLRFTGLPKSAPDSPVTVIEVECDSEPVIDHEAIRSEWPRHKVGIS
jgi:alpha-L-fucosidase